MSVLKAGMETPWKIQLEMRRCFALPWARCYFAIHGVPWNRDWRMFGLPLIQRHRNSRIAIGPKLQMRNWFDSNPLGVKRRSVLATWAADAEIQIGQSVGITGAAICAQTSIRIGDRVRLGANCTIADTDFHPINAASRKTDPKAGVSRPIVIEDDVFIGMSVLILKGVRIGCGSVIGAGSVVAKDIPAGVVAAGNPARPIRELAES